MRSLLVTGSVGLDTVETPANSKENTLGGSATYFAIGASFLNPVRFVAAVGEDFPDEHLKLLKRHDMDLSGLEIRKGSKTFRWHGKYHENMNSRETISVDLNILAEPSPKVPDNFKDSEYIFLANNDPVLQLEFLDQLDSPEFVVCDTMDLWIDTQQDNLKKLLARVDGIILNDSEAIHLTGENNLFAAARAVCKLGPKFVVIKKGEHGALLYDEGKILLLPAYPIEEVVDPTGAGDSFAGGFMGYLAANGKNDFQAQANALVYATVIASFNIESFSLDSLDKLTRQQIDNRKNEFLKMSGKGLIV